MIERGGVGVKIVRFEQPGGSAAYGILAREGVVSLDGRLSGDAPQEQLGYLIDNFTELRSQLDALAENGESLPLSDVRLLAPVPCPGKIVCTTAVYAPGARAEAQQLLATLKSAESVVGPGGTVKLPDVAATWQFVPQAALGLVIRGPAKSISSADWHTAVFGYTCVVDVMARGDQQFGRDFWLAKADTLGPLGPCIVTVDELPDPDGLRVRSWQNGTLAQDYAIADASHSIAEQVEFVTTVMTLLTGDVVACGSSTTGQRPVADGEQVEVEIDGVGRLGISVMAKVAA